MLLHIFAQHQQTFDNIIMSADTRSRGDSTHTIQPFLGMAASLVYILAMDWYPLISPERKRLPESQFNGLSGSGWAIKAIIALQTDWSVQAGLHAFFKISRQISPVCRTNVLYTIKNAQLIA